MSTRLLALDASSKTIGWALIVDGRPATAGTVYILKGEIGARCAAAERALLGLVTKYGPTALAIEAPAYHAKPMALIAQQRVAGVLLLTAHKLGLSITEVPPSSAKKTFTGNGVATKEQVQDVAQRWSGLVCDEHAADALAIGYTALMQAQARGE